MAPAQHFSVVSSIESPSASELGEHLERTWKRFRALFGVEPEPVKVVLSTAAPGTQSQSRADQTSDAPPGRTIAWAASEGDDLEGQGFSDLSHEIAHIYFLDLMGNPQGLHQDHAWLHEAVACHHEGDRLVLDRRTWIRERIGERIPLDELFTMKNPVKTNPLVELTVELHGQLAQGQITVQDLNQRVSTYASSHVEEIRQAGITNMTYYAQSLSLLEFLIEREGRLFVRTMAKRLKRGDAMEGILRAHDAYPDGAASLEAAWVRWVEEKATGLEPSAS